MSPLSPVTPLDPVFKCPPPNPMAEAILYDMRLDEIEDLASRAISFWISLREGAISGEPMTIATHLRQVRLTTFEVAMIVRDMRPDEDAPALKIAA